MDTSKYDVVTVALRPDQIEKVRKYRTFRREFVVDAQSNQLIALIIASPLDALPELPPLGGQELLNAYPVSPEDEDFWQRVLQDMAIQVQHHNQFEHAVTNYRRLILAEVIRRRWDSKCKVRGTKRNIKPFIGSAAEVTDALITLIIGVFNRKPCGYAHPALWFKDIFLENEAIGTLATTNGAEGKTRYIETIYQKANQQIDTLSENPFSKPHTKHLFDHALKMAESVPDFRPNFFAPYVTARGQQTKILKQANLLNRTESGGATVARQGRKKKKVDPEMRSSKGFQKKKSF